MKNNKRIFIRIIAFVIAAAIAVFIFAMSSQSRKESANTSGGIIRKIAEFFNSEFQEMTETQQSEYIESFQFIIRKTAHFSLYAALCFCLGVAMMTFSSLLYKWRYLIAYASSVLYAVSDEVHQLFVPGRGCQFRDVCIDACGAAFGLMVVWGCFFIYKKYVKKSNKSK